jgi:hypothetical protein
VKGTRGRRRKQLLEDVKETSGYWAYIGETLDHTQCKTRFWRDYGPVVRQNAEWIDEWMNEWMNSSYMGKSKKSEDSHHTIFAGSLNSSSSSAPYCQFAALQLINRYEIKWRAWRQWITKLRNLKGSSRGYTLYFYGDSGERDENFG